MELDEQSQQKIREWIDEVPLSRPKKNFYRDFSDGVMVAEVINQYFPKLVELHNYVPASALLQKKQNWNTLNQKIFKRLRFQISQDDINRIVSNEPGVIETVLAKIQNAIYEKNEATPRQTQAVVQSQKTVVANHPQKSIPNKEKEIQTRQIAKISKLETQNNNDMKNVMNEIDTELIIEKERKIMILTDENEKLSKKVEELSKLLASKDEMINKLKNILNKK